jgi:N-acetylneuraminate synthase
MFQSEHTFVIAEAGINHNGSLDLAKRLVDVAAEAGCDAVKFQKRTPHMSLPPHLWNQMRDTPWGERMTYLAYRQKIELESTDYYRIVDHCKNVGILFSASPWDINAANTVFHLGAQFIKIASASVTNLELMEHIASFKRPVVMSTGMCNLVDINKAVALLEDKIPELALLVCTSSYPAAPETLNLKRIWALQEIFPEFVIGYSGHEPGLWTTLCAVAMGAKVIERHITLDRTMKGSDQAMSIEPAGFKKLVSEIRTFEKARGSGDIHVLDCETESIKRLRHAGPFNGASQEA